MFRIRMYKDAEELETTRVQDDPSVIASEFINFIATVMTSRLFNEFDRCSLFENDTYKNIMDDLAVVKCRCTSALCWRQ